MFIKVKTNLLTLNILLIGAIIQLGCTKDFNGINTNPVVFNKDNFNSSYLLTAAEVSYPSSQINVSLIYCSTMMQGFSSVLTWWGGDKYTLNFAYSPDDFWNDQYPGAVKPIVELIQSVRDKPENKNLYQVARIMKALIMERLTDVYGDLPYFMAGMGFYNDSALFPKFDKQENIYLDLLKEVEEATNSLDDAGDKLMGDLYFNGDIDKWRRFGNTLLLRMAMRLTKRNPDLAKKYVVKVIGKTMQSNDDDAFLFGDETGGIATDNHISEMLSGRLGQDYYYLKWSKTFIDFLRNTNDPRLGRLAVTNLYLSPSSTQQNAAFVTDPSNQKGMPNGKDLSNIEGLGISRDPSFTSIPDYSSVTPYMTSLSAPTFILTYAESELLLADAAQRWGLGGDPEVHYKQGVKAAMRCLARFNTELSISDAEIESYLSSAPYEVSHGLEMINTQCWVLTCSIMDFYEAWFNWRRTGLPVLIPINYPGNETGGDIPRRMRYPLSEASSNPVNFKIASEGVPGGDNMTGRVWLDPD